MATHDVSLDHSSAAETAEREALTWARIAADWLDIDISFVQPACGERAVTGHSPDEDLRRRGEQWGWTEAMTNGVDVVRFAAALAHTESLSWADDVPDVATRAHDDRRHLIGDRLMHWLVPWLDAAGRCHHELAALAHGQRDEILAIGERLRIAPALAGTEGRFLPGEDAIGPIAPAPNVADWLRSLASGLVITDATVRSLSGGRFDNRSQLDHVLADDGLREDLATYFTVGVGRWKGLEHRQPGTAELWAALSARCQKTADLLAR